MPIINTGTCCYCNEEGSISMTDEEYEAFSNRPRNQQLSESVPSLTIDEREQLITGTHGACFDALFADED